MPATIPRLRWWIGGLLFASTVINYIDRQTLNVLAPILKDEFSWSNADFATILIAFRVAYTFMQAAGGRLIDLLGTRRGLALSVTFYSAVAMLTSTAQSIGGFRLFRFLLGMGEGPNWPAAAKATAEWFPARERGWAVALYDSGSAVGGAIAPFLVLWAYQYFGSWRPVFVVTGMLGVLWLVAWLLLYYLPEQHARLSPAELAYIRQSVEPPPAHQVSWWRLLRYRQTWGIVLGRARRFVLLIFGPAMLLLIPAAFTSNYFLIISLFGFASFAYAACATIFLAFPGDVFRSNAVASVSGLSGAGAGLGVLASTYLIGQVTDRFSFQPVILAASMIPCLATWVLVKLVRAPARREPDGVLNDF
jgi:sugar phosphate permease